MASRGRHLVRADRGFATGGGLLARLSAPAFSRLLEDVATETLHLARSMVKKVHGPVLGELKKWGIKVVVWKPTAINYGDLQSA